MPRCAYMLDSCSRARKRWRKYIQKSGPVITEAAALVPSAADKSMAVVLSSAAVVLLFLVPLSLDSSRVHSANNTRTLRLQYATAWCELPSSRAATPRRYDAYANSSFLRNRGILWVDWFEAKEMAALARWSSLCLVSKHSYSHSLMGRLTPWPHFPK